MTSNTRKTWHVLSVEADSEQSEILSCVFSQTNSCGVIEEPCNSTKRTLLKAYFDAEYVSAAEITEAVDEATKSYPPLLGLKFSIVTAGQGDWQTNWRQYFKPFEIVPDIIVAPSWEDYKVKDSKKLITLDPGMAFGTGLHETTRLCAEMLPTAILPLCPSTSLRMVSLSNHKGDLEGVEHTPSLLDVGTGSGILAMVAAKMGVAKIAAVENDPDALTVARENFKKNKAAHIDTFSDLAEVKGQFDVIVANILLNTLIEIKDNLVSKLKPDGFLILSGITNDQEASLKKAFSDPFKFVKCERMGEWSCLNFLLTKR